MALHPAISLPDYYRSLWEKARPQLQAGHVELDPMLSAPATDARRGITLLARPSYKVTEQVQHFLKDVALLEPDQYFYPSSDLHVTVLSLISCFEGFALAQINPEAYIDLVQSALRKADPFLIHYQGVTASPAGIMLQGFPETDGLQTLRATLRRTFKSGDLPHSIDQRYAIKTAHTTVIRFQVPLLRPQDFVQKIEKYRNFSFGSFLVDRVELVFNDWYQRQAQTTILASFPL